MTADGSLRPDVLVVGGFYGNREAYCVFFLNAATEVYRNKRMRGFLICVCFPLGKGEVVFTLR